MHLEVLVLSRGKRFNVVHIGSLCSLWTHW